jgi:hypothetical protein
MPESLLFAFSLLLSKILCCSVFYQKSKHLAKRLLQFMRHPEIDEQKIKLDVLVKGGWKRLQSSSSLFENLRSAILG